MRIGPTIKSLRKAKGMTQQELAEKSGITQTYFCQIELGKKEAHTSTLEAIARNLDTTWPAILFLSLEESDIKPGKLEIFRLISPIFKELLS